MEDRIIALAREYDMLPAGETVLCALSGGRDSMCLLWLLHSLAEELQIRVEAAHFDHRLRPESGEDAAFVRAFCQQNGIPFYEGGGDVAAFAKKEGLGLEEAGRILRYRYLEETADKISAGRIATAHNADDNVETVLLNLTRGAGLRGMAGIPPRRGRVVRPLLCVSRAEIDAYVAECHLPFVEDKSNADERFARNKLRHQVLPVLKELNPKLCENAFATTRLLRADAGCLDAMAYSFLEKNRGEIIWGGLKRLPTAVQSRVVRQAAGEYGPRLTRSQTEKILALPPQGALDLPGGVIARREYDKLLIQRKLDMAPTFTEKTLAPGQTVALEEIGLEVSCSLVPDNGKIHSSVTTFYFKSEMICGTICIRPRRSGDSLRTRPGKGRSLKRLFIDAKLPRDRRELVPVAADDAGVLGVFGFGQDTRCAPDGTGQLLKIEIKERKQAE